MSEGIQATAATTDYAMGVRLDYARPRARKRWIRWVTATVIVVAAAAGAGWYWGRPHWPQARYLYWQDRCMRYDAPSDLVVYEEDATKAQALLSRGVGEYQTVASLGAPTSAGLAGPPVGHIPAPLRNLGSGWVCIAFLHGRYTPSGEKRLAVVGYQVHGHGNGRRVIEIYGPGKTLADWTTGSTIAGAASARLELVLGPSDRLRLYAGQADPKDRTRFTMRYELNGQNGTVEGRLLDSGSFQMRVLDGPARGHLPLTDRGG